MARIFALLGVLLLAACAGPVPPPMHPEDRPTIILLGKDGAAIKMPPRATQIQRVGDTIILR